MSAMTYLYLPLAAGIAAIGGCATPEEQRNVPGCVDAQCVAIGTLQNIASDVAVTPMEVIEDSRCPIEADCTWEGRVVVKVQLDLGHESIYVNLDTSKPLAINAGLLSIAEVAPQMSVQWAPIKPEEYQFGFRFVPDVMPDGAQIN